MQPTQLRLITDRLSATFGMPENHPDHDPLGGLVATILSQSTSDVNSHRAYADLRLAFPTWDDVMEAPPETVARAIYRGGLANIKAARIQAALHYIATLVPAGDDSLDVRFTAWLQSLPVAEARSALQKIPSVGPKTAACVLLFNMGEPSMPVDTHLTRITLRLGLVPPKTSVARIHEAYDAVTPPELVYPLHVLLITLGRKICRARNPLCTRCPLLELCPTGRERREGKSTDLAT